MGMRLLALVGFAKSEEQAKTPPLLAYLGLIVAAYFAATIVEWMATLLGTRWSIYLRTVGLVSTLLVAHALYRAVVHRDDLAWGGWIRRILQRD